MPLLLGDVEDKDFERILSPWKPYKITTCKAAKNYCSTEKYPVVGYLCPVTCGTTYTKADYCTNKNAILEKHLKKTGWTCTAKVKNGAYCEGFHWSELVKFLCPEKLQCNTAPTYCKNKEAVPGENLFF